MGFGACFAASAPSKSHRLRDGMNNTACLGVPPNRSLQFPSQPFDERFLCVHPSLPPYWPSLAPFSFLGDATTMCITWTAISSKRPVGITAIPIAIIGGAGTSVIRSAKTPACMRMSTNAITIEIAVAVKSVIAATAWIATRVVVAATTALGCASLATTMRTAQNAARSASILMIKPRTMPSVRVNAPVNPIVPIATPASILATPSNVSPPRTNALISLANHAIDRRNAHKMKRA